MFDPGAIGTLIIGQHSETGRALELEQSTATPKRSESRTSGLSRSLARSLARSLRSVADRLEPSSR